MVGSAAGGVGAPTQSTVSANRRRGVGGSGSALIGAHPTRSSICGWPPSPNSAARTASRVAAISSGSVTGQLASPSAVAVNSTTLVASPARSQANRSSAAVPNASSTE